MRKFYTTLKMDFIFSGLRRLICHLCSGPEFIKIKLQKVQSFYLMIFIMLLSGTTIVKSQTTLSAGDILITSFDATKTVTDDKFSFVTLKDLQPNTVIYFTDRGYFGNNTWQSANGGTEGSISWSLGSDNVAAGTEVVIQSLSAKVNNVAKGSVASIAGSNANGLSLSSPSGDQIIAFQGGAGNPAAIGVTMIGGFHWNYCPIDYYSVYTTDASWDTIGVNSACSAGPNSSNMPPGLNASTAFWVGFFKPTPPAKNIQNYTKGQFNGAGAPFSSLAALKAAILNRNNWTALKYDDPTVVNVPTGYTFYSACTAPAITSQPSASTICAESNTTFSAVFSNATGYQWQVDRGAGFINISNTAPYSGANTATLTITGATAGINGYAYRVVATGACSPAATSNSATLTVNSAPAITSQPNASAICAGSNTTFSAVSSNATGYQWQVDQGAGFINISNTAPYSGANTATLTITGATAGINGYAYRVIATGSCSPAATSNSAKLTVNSAPAITSQPSASTICAGANTIFTAAASNATGYQWQVDQGAGFINISNGAPYSGATTGTLTITGATAGINGYAYRVVAAGSCSPAATSNSATLTVNSAPAITSQPSASTICAGANTIFTAAASNATGYQWQVDQGAGFINISNGAPYSGATTGTLTITGATAGINGYAYRVVAAGSCSPAATSNSATLTVNSAPAITSQPSASTICAGANTIFTAAASNATGYQWQVDQGAGFINISNGAPYSGATTATLTITGATAGINGYAYRVVATGSCSPAATSNSATLTVSSVTGSATKNNVSCNGGSNGSITLTPSGGTAPYTYNWGGGILTKDRVGLTAGIYTVTIKDANGCTGNVSVTIIEPALLVATAGAQTNVSCNGGATGSATVKVTGGTGSYTYSWSPSGGTAATANGLAAGTYLVTITDTNGCQTTQSFTITQAELVAAPTGVATQSFNPGDTLSVLVVNGQGIKWYATPNDVINHVNALPTTTVIVNNKTYYATQTISGCESKTSLAVLAYNETLGVNNASKGIKLQVYPNPVNDVLHFIGEDKITKIVIISIDGKKISEKTMSNERRLNVHTLIQGTYLINIFTDRGLQTIKFIKK